MEAGNRHFRGKYDLFTIYLVPGLTIFLPRWETGSTPICRCLETPADAGGLLMLWDGSRESIITGICCIYFSWAVTGERPEDGCWLRPGFLS